MEGAEAEVPRKKSSNNLTHAAERHCTRAAGRRAPTHRPSPRAGRGAITWDLKIRNRNGIRPRLAENGPQGPGEVSLPTSPPGPLSADCVNQPEETWRRGGGTFGGRGERSSPLPPRTTTPPP